MIVHELLGFDKKTEMVVHTIRIPDDDVAFVRQLLGASPDWEQDPGDFWAPHAAAEMICAQYDVDVDVRSYDWFLSPSRQT